MMLMESALAIRFRTVTKTKTTTTTCINSGYRPWLSYEEAAPRVVHFSPRRNSIKRSTKTSSLIKKTHRIIKSSAGPGAAEQSSDADPPPPPPPTSHHPFEEIGISSPSSSSSNSEDAIPSPAEMTRTLIEVNSKATLMFSGLIDDQFPDSIFWPDLPYLTDEHGNIYFEVKDNEDLLQTLTNDNNYVQVVIGLDTVEMMNEMELGPSDIDFGFEEIMEEDSDDGDDEDDIDGNDDYENDWVEVLDGEEDDMDSDGTLGDWAKLGTMRSSHPMYFAKKLSEVAADDPMIDCMDQPAPGICIQGLLRPAFIEESSVIRKHNRDSSNDETNRVEKVSDDIKDQGINGHDHDSYSASSSQNGSIGAEEADKDENSRTGSSFYKLEMIKIQFISPHGNQIFVEVNDFQKAQPDAIAHSAPKIISRVKAGGEKFIQALKSLCWRVKGIQAEEAILIGVDSLGFDLRICSGKQVENLRFGFNSKANSEYSAERQLHDLLFPRVHQKPQKRQEAHTKEL
ncbi:Pentatricopeptide repeat (PPR) superfamily protein [Thalictrum thalictroides]|uniref:Pentatricopeptide repeat (PPR) superfamily protein n=1 Tax=Thalictrum thalictroides TaxID=46969 RepID=A0A7J6V442_THATH|nr:Pentatricopeptide repeat (PPR) superfamily protein [Thalictrum thalictroides]